jgi:hypothetical protein
MVNISQQTGFSQINKCKLCLKPAQLCDSHLIAAAFFRLLRSKTITPSDPLVITPSTTLTSSRQLSDYLLCVNCEDRLRARGEDWVINRCYRGEGQFVLRDLVLSSKLLDAGEMGTFYSAKSNPQIDTEALTYFAASVFWRAAVHDWEYLKLRASISLGCYEEQFRSYLLGEAPFPKSAAMWVWVSRYEEPSRAVSTPHSIRVCDCYMHIFDVPGLRFSLLVGQMMPDWVQFLCILNGRDQPILVSDAPDDILAADVQKASQTTHLSSRLQKLGKWVWSRPI